MRVERYPPGYDHNDMGFRATVNGEQLWNYERLWEARNAAEAHAGVSLHWDEIEDGDEYCRGVLTAMHCGVLYRVERRRRHPPDTRLAPSSNIPSWHSP